MKSETVHMHTQSKRKTYYLLFLLLPALAFVSFLASFVYVGRTQKDNEPVAIAAQNTKKESIVQIGGVEVSAAVVDTVESRARGLSGRRSLAEREGMLFDFGQENVRPPFWMKDMLIPIDIIWINDGVVVQITENATPPEAGTPDNLLDLYIPNSPIDLVLEVRAGFAAENGIELGSRFDYNAASAD